MCKNAHMLFSQRMQYKGFQNYVKVHHLWTLWKSNTKNRLCYITLCYD